MVARNCTLQDLPYARLLQVSEEDREFLALDELKPHQLTELSGVAPAVALASENGTNNNTNNKNNNLSSEESPSGTRIITERQLTNQIISEKVGRRRSRTNSGSSANFCDFLSAFPINGQWRQYPAWRWSERTCTLRRSQSNLLRFEHSADDSVSFSVIL